MLSLRLLHDTSPESTRELRPVAFGLAVGIALTWLLSPRDSVPTLSWIELWILATRCTVPVLAATAIAVWGAARFLSCGTERERIDTALDVACVATWFPPLLIFFRQDSPWAVVLGMLLAALLTRAVLVRADPSAVEERRTLVPAVCTGMSLEAGAAALTIGDWQSCTLALAGASSFLTWMLTTRAVWRRPASGGNRSKKIRIIPALLFGVTVSAGGLAPYLAHPSKSGNGNSDHGGNLPRFFGGPGASREGRPTDTGRSEIPFGQSWPGVILWPDAQKYVTLVAPLPRSTISLFRAKKTDTLSIPFYGAYWYFKGPGEPPPNSYVTHGDPAKLSFRSTDLLPLTMEARQNFGRLIDMDCCSAIAVSISNGDRQPDALRLSIQLKNTTLPGKPQQWLGALPVGPEAAQTLTFPMPAARQISQFDEITVQFHLMWPRADRSARIAVRRFVFVR